MKTRTHKLTALLLALLMALSCAVPAFAADGPEPFAYNGDKVSIIKADGSEMGMTAPQEGTTASIDGDNVVIHYIPKRTTYTAIHWGAINDAELTAGVTANSDGSFDITLPKDQCGWAIPIALLKADGTTTGDQYYLAIPAEDKLTPQEPVEPEEPENPEAPAVEPFPYDGDEVQFINVDGNAFGMFTPQEGTTASIDGDNVVIHYVPKNTTVYGAIYFGAISDAELTADVTFNGDGSFDITLPKDRCGWAIPVAPIKIKDGGTTSSQYYLAIPAADKLTDVTDEPETADYSAVDAAIAQIPDDLSLYTDESVAALREALDAVERDLPADRQADVDAMARAIETALAALVEKPSDGRVDLEIINNTGMFKALFAYVQTEDGQSTLVVALTGSTYHYLYKGTYAQAVANGDNRDSWIAGYQNEAGKWLFDFDLADGETYIPVVSISNTYLTSYERGDNPLERAFYPRQLELDLEAATLTVGDYDETVTVSVTSRDDTFQVADTARMRVVGGPNSNNFRISPVLQMLDDTYDQVTYPTVTDGKLTTATAALSAEGTFTIDMLNAPNLFAFREKEPIELQLRVKATGETVNVTMTIDLLAGTLVIGGDSAPEAESIVYTFTVGGNGQWTQGSDEPFTITVKRSVDDASTFSRFTGVLVDGETVDPSCYTATAGSVNIALNSSYLATLSAGTHTLTVTFTDDAVSTEFTVLSEDDTTDEPDEPTDIAEEPAQPEVSPKTGDGGVTLWAVLLCLSAAGAVTLTAARRRRDA